MFKCKKCGNVQHGVTEFRVVTEVRSVSYSLQVRYDKTILKDNSSSILSTYKTIKQTSGTEIVKEVSYCKEHIPKDLKVKVLPNVQRTTLVGIKNDYRGDR